MTFNPRIAAFVGQRIKEGRDKLGLSAEKMGGKILRGGISESSIIRYEHGDQGTSLETLCLIAIAQDREPAELLPTLAQLRKMFPKARPSR
jgi:transcriptional regulator with XRE-family HTH domain